MPSITVFNSRISKAFDKIKHSKNLMGFLIIDNNSISIINVREKDTLNKLRQYLPVLVSSISVEADTISVFYKWKGYKNAKPVNSKTQFIVKLKVFIRETIFNKVIHWIALNNIPLIFLLYENIKNDASEYNLSKNIKEPIMMIRGFLGTSKFIANSGDFVLSMLDINVEDIFLEGDSEMLSIFPEKSNPFDSL